MLGHRERAPTTFSATLMVARRVTFIRSVGRVPALARCPASRCPPLLTTARIKVMRWVNIPCRWYYPSDPQDREWALIEGLLPPVKPGGRPCTTDLRELAGPGDRHRKLNRPGLCRQHPPHHTPPYKITL